jgi:DNA invertase Pin-like site-specific DNA recombinase
MPTLPLTDEQCQEAADAALKGQEHPLSKLTDADVIAIRQATARGEPATKIAARYGIHFGTVYQIKYRNTWKHLP